MSDLKGKTCQFARPWGPRCGKPAKTEHEGKFYCGIHNPVKRAARQAEGRVKLALKREDLRIRKARKEAGEEALELLKLIKMQDFPANSLSYLQSKAQIILAKAEGKS